eukprot:CAMPEP_0181217728 /NCGR_PEP_ID=MMETSP1096-20121128/27306_1 /TAXON_ID=156174 ORGANISM="Chrysochromulina ericina, Strain CCMP281" /NCGR_SAMPLE_ID=MMETSP1096 /ASSEMBLY_ACC=CAM_ASM_000453 /LENGTH=117 /DNA_ID=CAMNT_0023309879 /DNA_START=242 /DNA_END=595 /DNA_ORIENTATION=-
MCSCNCREGTLPSCRTSQTCNLLLKQRDWLTTETRAEAFLHFAQQRRRQGCHAIALVARRCVDRYKQRVVDSRVSRRVPPAQAELARARVMEAAAGEGTAAAKHVDNDCADVIKRKL